MSKRITIRLSDAEHQFLQVTAHQKSMTMAEAARHFFLQNIALDAIKTEVRNVVQAELLDLRAELQAGQEILAQQIAELQAAMLQKDDLIKATNFIVSQVKK